MKTLTKSILIVLCITLFSSVQLFGQEWSAEQKEVWESMESAFDLWAKEDIEGVLAFFHDDFSSWNNNNPLPTNKASLRKNMVHWFPRTAVVIYDNQPVGINIFDNVAIVQYYWSNVIKDAEGKEINDSGRWTDILMKQGDKWVFIGDSGGSTD